MKEELKALAVEAAWMLIALIAVAAVIHVGCETVHGGVSEAMDAVCRITALDGGRGTGTVFHRDQFTIRILTNEHVVGPTADMCQCEFFVSGVVSKKVPGRVRFRRRHDATDQDVAIVEVSVGHFGAFLPRVVPLAKPGEAKYGRPMVTIGCPSGGWSTAVKVAHEKTFEGVVIFSPAPAQGRSGSPLLDEKGEKIIGLVAWNNTQAGTGTAQTIANLARAFEGKAGFERRISAADKHVVDPAGPLVAVVRPGEQVADCYLGPDGKQYCLPPGVQPPAGFRKWQSTGNGYGWWQQAPQPQQGTPTPGPETYRESDPPPNSGQRYEAWPKEPARPDEPKQETKPAEPKQEEEETPAIEATKPWYERQILGTILGTLAAGLAGGVGIKAWLAGRVARKVGNRIQEKVVERVKRRRQKPLSRPRACDKAPEGWYCTREAGHDGPCAAEEALYESRDGERTISAPTQVQNVNIYPELDVGYAETLAAKRAAEFAGMNVGHQALIGSLYREAVGLLRDGSIPCLGGKETADKLDGWVSKEFLVRHNIRIG